VRETRRLYGQLQRAAETRRQLLAQVVQRTDEDRHRVAAQLHEQAVAAYATFVSFMQTGALSPPAARRPLAGASAIVRDELGKQAESLRRLMLAVQPLQVDRSGSRSLDTPIRAYVDRLYGDRRAPVQEVAVDDDLVLDWATETVVLRIVQEAVSNVWRHSQASRLAVTIGADEGVVAIEVIDDGIGFDPAATLFESGIAVMRSLAGLGDGDVAVDSAPGRGTRIRARLGGQLPAPDPVPPGPPRLRLVTGTLEADRRDASDGRDGGLSVGEA
jgi:signal transduction histidine kinase